MRQAVLEDRKSCTTRSEKKGEVGDRWALGYMVLEYTRIEKNTLDHVARHLYKEEGFNSPDEFRDTWCRLHRMKPSMYPAGAAYWKREVRYTHWFKEVKL
jgi:hypothetical protein